MLASIKNHLKIVLPPIPRYVFGSCCNDTSHAPNVSSPTHITTSLTEHIRQRSTIIRKLHDHKTQHFKVIDLLGIFAPTSASITDKGIGLKCHTHRDNVHLTENGYKLVANTIISEAKLLRDRVYPPSNPTLTARGERIRIACVGRLLLHRRVRQDGVHHRQAVPRWRRPTPPSQSLIVKTARSVLRGCSNTLCLSPMIQTGFVLHPPPPLAASHSPKS